MSEPSISPVERFKLIPAVYLVLRKDSMVLLLRRANTGYQDGNYSVIAGHLEGGEFAAAGMIREAKEEAGIDIDPVDLKLVRTIHRLNKNEVDQERIDLFFEATRWHGEIINAEPNKCDDLSWFPISHLPNNMLPFVKEVITDTSHQISYSEYTSL